MKAFNITLLSAMLAFGMATLTKAQTTPPAAQPDSSPPATSTNHPPAAEPAPAAATTTNAAAPPISSEYGADGLRVNFHGAPLNLVLDYLSDAAGFIINKQTDVRCTVEVWSKQPVTKDDFNIVIAQCRDALARGVCQRAIALNAYDLAHDPR